MRAKASSLTFFKNCDLHSLGNVPMSMACPRRLSEFRFELVSNSELYAKI
jgi:hypothetical protein